MNGAGTEVGEAAARPVAPQGDKELIEFVRGRSVPCPRCGYELRDLEQAKCPECGEPLVLMVGSPQARFGWLVLAMAPGCFSFVAATLLVVPLFMMVKMATPGRGLPWPVMCAEVFGWLSTASVLLMYRRRHVVMAWPRARQVIFAAGVWGIHILAFAATFAVAFIWF